MADEEVKTIKVLTPKVRCKFDFLVFFTAIMSCCRITLSF